MGWVLGTPSPQPSPAMRERESENHSGQRALQTPMRNQVRARHIAGARQKQPSSSPLHSGCETKAAKFEPITQRVRDKKQPRQQAVMERVCDEKSGERRGDNLQITTQAVACFRKIFAAQIPPSPQRDQAKIDIVKSPRSNATRLKRTV